MSDPYRELQGGCPRCKRALRAFNGRLICDDCGGILLAVPDLGSSITDLTGTESVVTFAAEAAAEAPCPRCQVPMVRAELHLEDKKLLDAVAHCAAHGVWLASGQLTSIFAVVGHAAGGGGSRHGYGGTHAGLRIGNWQSKARPRQIVTPIDAFAELVLACPACATTELAFQGDRYGCAQCTGVFVQYAALVALIGEMTGAPYEIPAPTGRAGERACPVCQQPMLIETFATVEIDRCTDHGIWFEPTELQTALGNAGATAKPGLGGWLGRLFRR